MAGQGDTELAHLIGRLAEGLETVKTAWERSEDRVIALEQGSARTEQRLVSMEELLREIRDSLKKLDAAREATAAAQLAQAKDLQAVTEEIEAILNERSEDRKFEKLKKVLLDVAKVGIGAGSALGLEKLLK